jgi:hypothetical protein
LAPSGPVFEHENGNCEVAIFRRLETVALLCFQLLTAISNRQQRRLARGGEKRESVAISAGRRRLFSMSCVIFCLRIRGDHVKSLP